MKKTAFLILSVITFQIGNISAQDFYDRSTVQTIEIFFGFASWDSQLDALASTTEDYLLADSVRINGIVFDSVGVKYKGNSSYNANNNKNPIHIELDYIHGSYDYQGYTDIKLQNGYQDPSMIREVLSYAILEQYMDCPKANFTNVYINGTLRGLYSSAESINKKFYGDHYYTSVGTAFKCNPIGGAGPGASVSPDLNYISTDTTYYYNGYELKSDFGWTDLYSLINTLNNDFSNIEQVMDVDRALWMLAFNNVLVNLDSYSGAFRQNYYLYQDLNDRFIATIWDLNMSFGGFPGGTGSGPLMNPSQLDPLSNSTSANHPLIVKILGNERYKKMYLAHLRTIVNEIFDSGDYLTTANSLRTTIDSYVQADPYKFFTYTQFQNSLTTSVSGGGPGPGSFVPGIQALMDARVTYFNSNTNFQQVGPAIVNNGSSVATPNYGQTITITAIVSNATYVYLGYRFEHPLKFTKIEMFDDGAHNDGAAGDNIYGADLTLNGVSFEYYIYADNASAGMFSPQRAEHEYYSLMLNLPLPEIGDVLINELMAINSSVAYDSNGESDDWVELFNATPAGIDLTGLYLSDDLTNLTKYQIPVGTAIPANDVLVIWTDEDSSQSGLHANFKLSGTGESVYLSDGVNVYDAVDFGVQNTDVSYARCPDGQTFTYATPTFDALNNCFLAVNELESTLEVKLYPVPTYDFVKVELQEEGKFSIIVTDLNGRKIVKFESTEREFEINSTQWSTGYYQVLVTDDNGQSKSLRLIKL
jgi:hypothetical protein